MTMTHNTEVRDDITSCQVLILVTSTGSNMRFVRGNFCSKLSKEFVSFILIFKAKLVHNSVVSQ